MDDAAYPRVAIVSANPLTPAVSNGLLMRSLFAGWPEGRLAQVCFPIASTATPPLDVCQDYRMIRPTGLVRRLTSGGAASGRAPAPTNDPAQPSVTLLGGLKRRKGLLPWLKLAQEAWYGNSWLGRVLERQLKALHPEIVYALVGNYSLSKITHLACARLGLPVYVHVTDDYVRGLYRRAPLEAQLAHASEKWFRRIANSAVGPRRHQPGHGGRVRSSLWGPLGLVYHRRRREQLRSDAARGRRRRPVRVRGQSRLGRSQQLRALALALHARCVEGRGCALLEIYSSDEQIRMHRQALNIPPVVRLRGWAPAEELPAIFHGADVLVHVESFDPDLASLTRMSLSTKLNQYLMAGRCVLGLGPGDLASMRLIRDAGAGVSIGEVDAAALGRQIDKLCGDQVLRHACGRRGRQWAEPWGNRAHEHQRFRKSLVDALQPQWLARSA